MENEGVVSFSTYFEGDGCSFDYGDIVVHMADGNIESDGNFESGECVANHGVHVLVGFVGGVFGELTHNQSGSAVEDSAHAELVEDSLNFVDGFLEVFKEED